MPDRLGHCLDVSLRRGVTLVSSHRSSSSHRRRRFSGAQLLECCGQGLDVVPGPGGGGINCLQQHAGHTWGHSSCSGWADASAPGALLCCLVSSSASEWICWATAPISSARKARSVDKHLIERRNGDLEPSPDVIFSLRLDEY